MYEHIAPLHLVVDDNHTNVVLHRTFVGHPIYKHTNIHIVLLIIVAAGMTPPSLPAFHYYDEPTTVHYRLAIMVITKSKAEPRRNNREKNCSGGVR